MSSEISKGFIEAPRPAMNETAFRRYEKWIARATKGSYMMEKAMLGETQANSWAVGFNEARRGYLKYGYGSVQIPLGYDLSKIKLRVGMDGRVLVENKWEDEKEARVVEKREEQRSVTVDSNGAVVWFNSKTKPEVEYVPDEQMDACIFSLQQGETDGFKTCYLVKPTSEANIAKLEASINKTKVIEEVLIEKLDHGWWRLQ